jgi:hypothetical protein
MGPEGEPILAVQIEARMKNKRLSRMERIVVSNA